MLKIYPYIKLVDPPGFARGIGLKKSLDGNNVMF